MRVLPGSPTSPTVSAGSALAHLVSHKPRPKMIHRLLVLSLAVLCYTHGSLAQCGGCSSETLNCGEGQCCTWDNPDEDTDPSSFSNSTRFPLGFVTSFIPSVESDDPLPCVTFTIPVIDRPRQNYMQVSIESTTDVCVYEQNKEDAESCGTEVFFCDPDGYTNTATVTFQFGCESCPAAETAFFFRIDIQTLDMVDEYWCDNANRTLPRDLIPSTTFTPVIDCGHLDDPENGTVSVSDTTYTSVANYSCDPGFGLIGDAMRTCSGTGNWSGSEPTCTMCSVNNCLRCDDDVETCKECQENYELSENKCKCQIPDCRVCDTDPTICDTCSEEGAKFDEQQSKCIVGDDGEDGGGSGGGLSVGAVIIGIIVAIFV